MKYKLKDENTENLNNEINPGYVSSIGDGGYQDTFNRLKQMGDFGRARYEDNLKAIDKKVRDMKNEIISDFKMCIFYVAFIILYSIILHVLFVLTPGGFLAGIYVIMNLFSYPIDFVVLFVLLPLSLIRLLRRSYRFAVLTEKLPYSKDKNILTINQAKRIYKQRINDYDSFIKAAYAIYDDEVNPDRNYRKDYDEMSNKQQISLDRMREVSAFPDINTDTLEGLKDMKSPFWIYAGVILLIAFLILVRILFR